MTSIRASDRVPEPRRPVGGGPAAAGHEQVLYSSARTRVVRVPRPDGADGTVVRKELLGPDGATRLRREAAVLDRVADVPGVVRRLDLPSDGTSLLFHDDHGRAVGECLPEQGFAPAWATRFGARLATVLAAVHRAGVVHRDINPANVLLAADGACPVLIDFGLASRFLEERTGVTDVDRVAGTLPYLAPEQTGRIGRPVDHRADLYGLGATLYELLSGRPPFGSGDALTLIHSHLALEPVPLDELRPQIPSRLAAVVARLLAKEPDQRYQSADGVAHDLRRIADLLDAGTPPAALSLTLGERDFPAQLSAPARLVGREAETLALADALGAARAGRCRGLLLSGLPGVGKTALLNQLHPLVFRAGGWFVTGKFDQYRQSPDTDAVAQVLHGLGRLLLADTQTDPARQREQLIAAVGHNAGLLARFTDLGTVLGVEPEPLEGDPGELAGRLYQATLGLLRTVASPQRPVVLVLEDLQWATAFAVGLLDAVLTAGDLDGLLLVGSFRDAEVDPTHPLAVRLARWERLGVVPERLALENLPPVDLAVMLAEMLRLDAGEAAELAEVVGARTGGNPFDTVELINALRQDGVLRLEDGGWTWDATAIRRFVGAQDVVALLHQRIDQLPPTAGHLLHVLACLGGEVDLARLATAVGISAELAREQLQPALEDRLLVALGADDAQPFSAVRFRHDRVQQAAYTQLDDADRVALHLSLGRQLAARSGQAGAAAEQYLEAVSAIEDRGEVRRAAGLLLSAAFAVHLTNASVADRYLVAAGELLARIGVTGDDPLVSDIRVLRHTVLYTLGRLEEADEVYRGVVDHATDLQQLTDAACLQIHSLTNRRRYADALALGSELLRQVGIDVPGPDQIGREVEEGLAALRAWVDGPADDPDRRALDDPYLVVAARIMNRLSTGAYFAGDAKMLAWLMSRAQRIWANHGPCAELVGAIGFCGIVTVGALNDYRIGYQVMQRVLPVAEARGYEPLTSQARLLFGLFSTNWVEPLEATDELMGEAREGCLRGGDLHFAGYAQVTAASARFQFVPTLGAVHHALTGALTFVTRIGHDSARAHLQIYLQLLQAMRGRTHAPGSFSDDDFDEEHYLTLLAADKVNSAVFHAYRAVSAALFDDPDALVRHGSLAMATSRFVPATFSRALAQLTHGLGLAHRVRTMPEGPERDGLLAELDECRAWVAARAVDAPVNFGHLAALLDAERAWAVGDFEAAALAFDLALREVEGRSRPWNQALITERAARFQLAHGLDRAGRRLLVEARGHYARWGATGKVSQLEERHPFLRRMR